MPEPRYVPEAKICKTAYMADVELAYDVANDMVRLRIDNSIRATAFFTPAQANELMVALRHMLETYGLIEGDSSA